MLAIQIPVSINLDYEGVLVTSIEETKQGSTHQDRTNSKDDLLGISDPTMIPVIAAMKRRSSHNGPENGHHDTHRCMRMLSPPLSEKSNHRSTRRTDLQDIRREACWTHGMKHDAFGTSFFPSRKVFAIGACVGVDRD